jgi:hypothetical protein
VSQIYVIDALSSTPVGPATRGPGKDWNEVFLAQGSADGACGLYSIFMGLIMCGVVDREELTGLSADKRTRQGKLQELIRRRFSGLIREGSYLSELASLLTLTFGHLLNVEYSDSIGPGARAFIAAHVLQGHPVVTGLDFEGGGHAVVAIGVAWDRTQQDTPDYLLLLDPSQRPPFLCAWNNVVILRSRGGRYPYRVAAGEYRVQLSEALAMWRIR